MQLTIQEIIQREIIHYADDHLRISSLYNRIYITRDGQESVIRLPEDGWHSLPGGVRLARRALRLDKCNVFHHDEDLVIIRQGVVYHCNLQEQVVRPALKLKNCRNILHQSACVTPEGHFFFGEYGNNASRSEVPIHHSRDGGRSWETAFTFPAGKIKHVHGCCWDPVEEKIWIFSGDFNGECYILCTKQDFKHVEWIGDGSQVYRACNAFFEKDAVHWVMDSQLEDSHHIRLERKRRAIQRMSLFPGPVWYIKRLSDGPFLAATAQEIGPAIHDGYAHIMASHDLENWDEVLSLPHDGLPKRLFKFGVIGFADGEQSSREFYIFGEALRGLEGKAARCSLEK